jgi:hypothetical protein
MGLLEPCGITAAQLQVISLGQKINLICWQVKIKITLSRPSKKRWKSY